MAMHDCIRTEVKAARLPPCWTTSDLLRNDALRMQFTESSLRTAPPNQSVSLEGLNLGTGASLDLAHPRYYRVGRRHGALEFALPEDAFAHRAGGLREDRGVREPAADSDDLNAEAIVEDDESVEESLGEAPIACAAGSQAYDALWAVVDTVNQEQPWDDRLRNYVWKGRTFFETQRDLAGILWRGSVLARLLEPPGRWNQEDEAQAVKWAMEIFAWGGTRQRQPVTPTKVAGVLANAMRGGLSETNAPMNSGYTKVASFATAFLEGEPGRTPQVINDSRVAAALTSRLDCELQRRGLDPGQVFPGLGTVNAARGGTRPRQLSLNWPSAYGRWSGQFAATQVVKCIRDILNERSPEGGHIFPRMPCPEPEDNCDWTMRAVEAVLFMDGY